MSTGLNENWGPLGIGDLTSEATASLSVRDATSTTLPTNTTRIKVNTSGGAAIWHGPADSNTLNWQTIAFWWESGQSLTAALDGIVAANSGSATALTGTTLFSGAIIAGAAGGALTSGKWPGLIDEIRIGKLPRSAEWRKLEHLSFTDATFTTLGAEETPAGAGARIIANPDSSTVTYAAGDSFLIDVLANDSRDPAGPALFVQDPTIAGDGTCVVDSNKLKVTPGATLATGGTLTGSYKVTDGTIEETGTWELVVDAAAVPVADNLYNNPFNKRAAHHRPIGAGAVDYIKGGVHITDWNAGKKSVYQPDMSPADSVTWLRDTIGDFRLGDNEQGRKYQWEVAAGDTAATWYEVDDNVTGRPRTGRTTVMKTPDLQLTKGGPKRYIPDFTGGDFEFGFAPEDGDHAATGKWEMRRFNDCDYRNKEYSSSNLFSLRGTDNFESPGGLTGGAGLRWPGLVLRGWEINPTNPAPIRHALNVTATRHDNELLKSVANGGIGRRAPEAHILAKTLLPPASRIDGSANPASRKYNPTTGPLENMGKLAYGSLLRCRLQDRSALFDLITTARGRAIIDAMIFYGCYVVDGQGRWVRRASDGRIQGVLQMRVDGLVGQDEYGNPIANVSSQLNAALRAMIPFLYVVGNRLTYGDLRAEDAPNGLPYVGGYKTVAGKRQYVLDAANPERSLNSAFDAPSPGYYVAP